jgi:hypothetical protein
MATARFMPAALATKRDATLRLAMAFRRKFPSDRPTEKPPMVLDDPFDSEPPTDVALTEPPLSSDPTMPPPSSPTTNPELPFYTCPLCEADNPADCNFCQGSGIIDRQEMDDFKKKRKP